MKNLCLEHCGFLHYDWFSIFFGAIPRTFSICSIPDNIAFLLMFYRKFQFFTLSIFLVVSSTNHFLVPKSIKN